VAQDTFELLPIPTEFCRMHRNDMIRVVIDRVPWGCDSMMTTIITNGKSVKVATIHTGRAHPGFKVRQKIAVSYERSAAATTWAMVGPIIVSRRGTEVHIEVVDVAEVASATLAVGVCI
jgi:hypothetical protein